MKSTLFIVLFMLGVLIPSVVRAQYIYQPKHTQTYWYYKYRLINQFLKVGHGQGESIPSGQRNRQYATNDKLYFGDGTAYLGDYIAVLATEYKLLDFHGKTDALENTKTQLYHALRTVERLDLIAENEFPYNNGPQSIANGFMFRDDVPYDWLQNPANYDHFNDMNDFFGHEPVSATESDYMNSQQQFGPSKYDNDAGQDQFIHILMGLSLTHKFATGIVQLKEIDGTVRQITTDPWVNLSAYAEYLAWRIVSKMVDDDWILENPKGFYLGTDNTKLPSFNFDTEVFAALGVTGWTAFWLYPSLDIASQVYAINPANNRRGSYAALMSDGFNDTYWQITGNHVPHRYEDIWETVDDALLLFHNLGGLIGADNSKMIAQLAALSDTWDKAAGISVSANVQTEKAMQHLTQYYDWHPFYQLLWGVRLNHSIGYEFNSFAQSLSDAMNTAPCNGPRFFGTVETPRWNSSARYIKDEDNQVNGQGGYHAGNFNGLDYMLLHNLAALYFHYTQNQVQIPFYDDYIDRHITDPINTNYSASTYTYVGFRSIEAENEIGTNAKVTYKAGKSVSLEPGFIAKSGATFLAHTGDFQCSNTTYYKKGGGDIEFAYGSTEPVSPMDKSLYESKVDPSIYDYEYLATEKSDLLETPEKSFSVYPNPTDGIVQISFSDELPDRIQLTDLSGKVAKVIEPSTKSISIDLSDLEPGVYIAKVGYGSKEERIKISLL